MITHISKRINANASYLLNEYYRTRSPEYQKSVLREFLFKCKNEIPFYKASGTIGMPCLDSLGDIKISEDLEKISFDLTAYFTETHVSTCNDFNTIVVRSGHYKINILKISGEVEIETDIDTSYC